MPSNTIDDIRYGLWYFGMFEPNDPRIERTMKAIVDRLWSRTDIGGLARYEGDEYHWDRALDQQWDKIPGNPWIISTLWLAQYRIAKAESVEDLKLAIPMIKWTCDRALPSGVLAEQIHLQIWDRCCMSQDRSHKRRGEFPASSAHAPSLQRYTTAQSPPR